MITTFGIALLGLVTYLIYNSGIDDSKEANGYLPDPIGNWEVTMLDGNIKNQLIGPAVKHVCEDFTEYVYKPVLDPKKTFIKIMRRNKKPQIKDIPNDVYMYDTLFKYYSSIRDDVEEEEGLFIFQFSFDNGFHSNKILEGHGEQLYYTELLKGLWSFEVGFTTELGVWGETISGTKWGGKSRFMAVGHFIDENKIRGQWTLDARLVLPGSKNCLTLEYGRGTWVAVRK